ncbi:MAG: DUF262 domain-containing protein [Lachnospiraceae bacterium]|nr:DUF262 domain-containing protein [Lachnospiraceae bacterium]
MKAITANPETVREVFSKRYIIPDFQRPYSWDRETCEKLWDDITSFYGTGIINDDKYFLGNIVINPASDKTAPAWEIVDGQQRLTTLLLLIKALHSNAGTVKALEECLRIKDPLTSALTDELRVNSHVISEDRENLQMVVMDRVSEMPECNILKNYKFFCEKISEWRAYNGQTSEALNNFILALLDNIVLLPIHCGSEDDALTIFETINNRGMSLSDADIFKAKLYHNTPVSEQEKFIEDWNKLTDHDWFFRILMHILRAEAGDSSKETSMRSYFTRTAKPLKNCSAIMRSLKIINAIYDWYGSDEIFSLWCIMNTYPNYYWNFPVFVFLHKYGLFDEKEEDFKLPDKYIGQFTALMEATVKYFFIKGVVYNSVNAVRDTVYKVCVSIEKEKDYLSDYQANIYKEDIKAFKDLLDTDRLKRCQRGIVLLVAYLNPSQDKGSFADFMTGRVEIEHILPKKWNNYDGWTDQLWSERLNTLGNLVPLSKKLNIAARNEFFDKKKEYYKESEVQDVKDLIAVKEWKPADVMVKQKEKIKRLLKYFKI